MNVLALNCGSSSIKFDVLGVEAAHRLARGSIERLGPEARARFEADGVPPLDDVAAIDGHAEGVRHIVQWLTAAGRRVDAVGHRVVHGGARFVESVRIDDGVIAAIEAMEELAPLHNAPSLAGMRAARAVLGALPMVAVFDTSFHATLPEHASAYAIPVELSGRHAIRRYGFHGTSYRSVLARYAELRGGGTKGTRLVALHLGHGCSAAAIAGGRSVDTSMGLTPLEGLMMGTRAGDLDPAIVDYLARRESVTATEVTRWLNARSGLRGVSGTSSDVRDLLAREADDPRARLALEMFCHRARKYVGAYLAALGGADAVIFTGGIGENAAPIRARICTGMEWCGLVLDEARNAHAVGREGRISADGAGIDVYVIPTDEERVIALDTAALVSRLGA
jgi:acetate kinase